MSKVITIALAEEGYLEKATNAQLDSKTANAGSNNWTKYARDLDAINFYNGKKNGYAWCDMFVDWCFVQAYGEELALKMTYQTKGGVGAGCTGSANYYKTNGAFDKTPKVGDQIFFTNDGGKSMYHTGLVINVDATRVYTIEGNTSSAAGVVENGGCVRCKSYARNYSYIGGYGHPNYSLVKEDPDMDEATLRKIIKEEIDAANYSKVYQTLAQVPTIYQPALLWLNGLGLLNGYDGGADKNVLTFADNTVRVDETFCRLVFILYNANQKGLLK